MAAAGEGFGGIVVIAVVVVVVLGLVMVSPPGPHRGDVTLPTATPRLLAMVTTVPPCNTNIKKIFTSFFPLPQTCNLHYTSSNVHFKSSCCKTVPSPDP